MTHTDFRNFVKHHPYYWCNSTKELVKFKALRNRRMQLWSLTDTVPAFYPNNLADPLKHKSRRPFWLTETEAKSKYPEYFI